MANIDTTVIKVLSDLKLRKEVALTPEQELTFQKHTTASTLNDEALLSALGQQFQDKTVDIDKE